MVLICQKREWKIQVLGVDQKAQSYDLAINDIPFFRLPYVNKEIDQEEELQIGRFEGCIKLNGELIFNGITNESQVFEL